MKTTLSLITLSIALHAGPSASADTDAWPGTLYRNGGHFGLTSSDAQLEQAPQEPVQYIIAGAPSSEAGEPQAQPAPPWSGTLYRNGGHFGGATSDEPLEGNR